MTAPAPGGAGPEEDLVGIEAAAAFLGVTVRWMRRRVAERSIPHYKLTGRLAFAPADLRQLRHDSRVEPSPGGSAGKRSVEHLRPEPGRPGGRPLR